MSEIVVDSSELLSIFETGVSQSVALVEHMPHQHRVIAWDFWKEVSKIVAHGLDGVRVTADGQVADILALQVPQSVDEVNIASTSNENCEQNILNPSCASNINDFTEEDNPSIDVPESDDAVQDFIQISKPHASQEKNTGKRKGLLPSAPASRRVSLRKKNRNKMYENIIPKSRKKMKIGQNDKHRSKSDDGVEFSEDSEAEGQGHEKKPLQWKSLSKTPNINKDEPCGDDDNISSDIEVLDRSTIMPVHLIKVDQESYDDKSLRGKCSCPLCGKILSNKANLKVHMRSHTGEKPFKCSQCERSFSTKPNLVRHERIHRGEKPYECPDCHKHFSEKKSMVIHRRTHTGERPYRCDICNAGFNQSGTLTIHRLIHTGTKSYSCDICGKNFRQKSQLTVHKHRHENIRNYNCTECKKTFISKGDLQRHLVRHTGERRFQCEICPKTFTRLQYLREHANKHSGQTPYPCSICKAEFPDIHSRSRHLKKHAEKVSLLARSGDEAYVVYLNPEQLLHMSQSGDDTALVVREDGEVDLRIIQKSGTEETEKVESVPDESDAVAETKQAVVNKRVGIEVEDNSSDNKSEAIPQPGKLQTLLTSDEKTNVTSNESTVS